MNEFYNSLLVLSSAAVMGLLIGIVYTVAHSRAVYASKMLVLFVVFSVLSAMLLFLKFTVGGIAVIGVAIIIRFRNPVKDHRDIVFILLAILSGFCCSAHMYTVLGVVIILLIALLYFLRATKQSERVLMVVKGDGSQESNIMESVGEFAENRMKLLVNNSSEDTVTELIYEIRRCEKPFAVASEIRPLLYSIKGVSEIHIMYQDDDMSI